VLGHGRIGLGPGGSIQLYGLSTGIRIGDRSQVTIAFGPTFVAARAGSLSVSGGLFTLLAQLVLVLGDHFSLLLQPAVDFDTSGAVGAIVGGLGVSF
jgi:hypothetical protein